MIWLRREDPVVGLEDKIDVIQVLGVLDFQVEKAKNTMENGANHQVLTSANK